MNFFTLIAFAIINIYLAVLSLKAADLTRQEPIVQIVEMLGSRGIHHYYNPSNLEFATGKLYRLIIKNKSNSKHYFSSEKFSKSIFTRKIQINDNKKKIAEVKGFINAVEIWPMQELEWWFVPIKAGDFEDLFCSVTDAVTNKLHKDMGMIGTIKIK